MQHKQGPAGGKGKEKEEGAAEGDAMTARYAPPGRCTCASGGMGLRGSRGRGSGAGGMMYQGRWTAKQRVWIRGIPLI